MDHKLAIVIVPLDSVDPVADSQNLLQQFQTPGVNGSTEAFVPKFRHKRVGGWFDGLVNGNVEQERWSNVLRVLYEGTATNAGHVGIGIEPETPQQVEAHITADNVVLVERISRLAPCSIIVTPAGEWAAHDAPDDLDDARSSLANGVSKQTLGWAERKEVLWRQYRGFTAVAWDLSWYFVGIPTPRPVRRTRTWGSRNRISPNSREAWAKRISTAIRARADTVHAAAALVSSDRNDIERWEDDGGATNRAA